MKSSWKKPDQYAFLDKATNEEIAWEFLRRSNAYKNDFEECKSMIESSEIEHGPYPKKFLRPTRSNTPHKFYKDIEIDPKTEWAKDVLRTKEIFPYLHPEIYFGLCWGVAKIVDPSGNEQPSFLQKRSAVIALTLGPDEQEHAPGYQEQLQTLLGDRSKKAYDTHALVLIDLSRPRVQVREELDYLLTDMQKNHQTVGKSKRERARLKQTLRTLDAKQSAATNIEIYYELEPQGIGAYQAEKSISDLFSSGKKLVRDFTPILRSDLSSPTKEK